MKVGWIGLGLMGRPMSARLVRAGHEVSVNSHQKDSARELIALGARWSDSVRECATGCDIVILMLPSLEAVDEVFAEILETVRPIPLIVDMSTSGPKLARSLSERAERVGANVLDAPVSGGPAGAEAGALTIMVGGNQQAFDTALPLMSVLGTARRAGGPGAGQRTKLVNQVVIAGVMAGISEAFALTHAHALLPDQVFEQLRGGMAGGALFEWAWPRLAADDLAPGFKITHMMKDLALALEDAEETNVSLITTKAVLDNYQSIVNSGGANLGTQALVLSRASNEQLDRKEDRSE